MKVSEPNMYNLGTLIFLWHLNYLGRGWKNKKLRRAGGAFSLQENSLLEYDNKIQQHPYVSVERESSEMLHYTVETWLVTTLKLQFFIRNAESHSSAKVHVLVVFLFTSTCSQCGLMCLSLSLHVKLIHTLVTISHPGVQHSPLQSPSRLHTVSSNAKLWSFVCLN